MASNLKVDIEGGYEYIAFPYPIVTTDNRGRRQDPRDHPREYCPSGSGDNHHSGSATRGAPISQGQGHHNPKSSSHVGASNSSNKRTQRNRDISKGKNTINGKLMRSTSRSPSPPSRRSYESFPPDLSPVEPWGIEGSQSGASDSQSAAHRGQSKLAHRPQSNTPSKNARVNRSTNGRDGAHKEDGTKVLRRKEAFRDEEILRAKEDALREASRKEKNLNDEKRKRRH
ncbi:hypothetical protein BTUL_0234g00080 [Botrytis tulipae]|uniref:Uncharacterized protein n=1 Tax=Botrytis tulipae TaxID=87230 RepID=A0A4Z1EEY0_9HELO|nr:hypothetical protein BTUL_0234g00080 [Botrytis tulipae]